jgi:hypothetical protein
VAPHTNTHFSNAHVRLVGETHTHTKANGYIFSIYAYCKNIKVSHTHTYTHTFVHYISIYVYIYNIHIIHTHTYIYIHGQKNQTSDEVPTEQ